MWLSTYRYIPIILSNDWATEVVMSQGPERSSTCPQWATKESHHSWGASRWEVRRIWNLTTESDKSAVRNSSYISFHHITVQTFTRIRYQHFRGVFKRKSYKAISRGNSLRWEIWHIFKWFQDRILLCPGVCVQAPAASFQGRSVSGKKSTDWPLFFVVVSLFLFLK